MAGRGFRVLIFDNRDAGLSTHLDGEVVNVGAVTAAYAAGKPVEAPYVISTTLRRRATPWV